ncbi:uncharacterized protein OCT59_023515 [Rhizophagus irregularis]|uniref:uncharacterized protein n=1 Tax=Rhizophagus irregularis TaxID=588596 RepID=UPI00332CAC34|nr:hypothetical protein OCT59_023515 [Rhizophagus irregularis]
MDEIKLSDDIFEQIKDFDYEYLTEEQESLIDKLITDEELNERYRENGLCKLCKQPKTNFNYCWSCNSQHFQQNFKNWTSGNHVVDEFIQKAQLKAEWDNQIIEWIEYDKFEDVEYLAKGGFGTTFKAVWKDGPWEFYYNYEQLERKGETKVALKCLHNSQDITADFLKEVESNILVYSYFTVRCFDPLKRPNANELQVLLLKLYFGIESNKVDSVIYGQVKEADEINKKSSIPIQLPLSSTSTLSYLTHPQAVYTSRILDFKNLPEPKNADSNDDLIGIEYSESIKVDFTKLNINSEDSYIIPYYNILLSRLEDFWDSPEAASNVISKLLEYYDKADTSIYTISLVLDPCLKFNT